MKKTVIEPHKSSLGMDANIAVLIIYIAVAGIAWFPFIKYIAWALPVVFFVLEKESKFVKFQAIQALIIGIARLAINIVFDIIYWILTPKTYYGALSYLSGGWGITAFVAFINAVIGLAITVLIVYLLIMAYGYQQVELPVIAPIAAKASEKLDNLNINPNKPGNTTNTTNPNDSNSQNDGEK